MTRWKVTPIEDRKASISPKAEMTSAAIPSLSAVLRWVGSTLLVESGMGVRPISPTRSYNSTTSRCGLVWFGLDYVITKSVSVTAHVSKSWVLDRNEVLLGDNPLIDFFHSGVDLPWTF